MISYIVLTPPGGADRDHALTRFIADRLFWWALLLPWIWFLSRRMWLAAALVLVGEVMTIIVTQEHGLGAVGVLSVWALHVLVALEGSNLHIRHLTAQGWNVIDLVTAPDLATAEGMFFAGLPMPEASPKPPASDWAKRTSSSTSGRSALALGLFDQTGAR